MRRKTKARLNSFKDNFKLVIFLFPDGGGLMVCRNGVDLNQKLDNQDLLIGGGDPKPDGVKMLR